MLGFTPENLREGVVVVAAIILTKGIEYLAVKIFQKLDRKYNTWLD